MGALPSASQVVNRSNGYSDIGSLRESITSVIGYGRCSTAEQASNGVSIEVQAAPLSVPPRAMSGI